MALFGPSLPKLVAHRDIPGLWKLYVKKKRRVGGEELARFPDEAWDYAYELFLTRKAKQFDVLEFASILAKKGKHYAGRLPVTPAEFSARLSVQGSLAGKTLGHCPACGEFLSSGGSSAPGHYKVCLSCRRYYHEACAESLVKCKLCEGWQWRGVHRTRTSS